MSSRDLIVVDLETGGLHDGAVILEVAAVDHRHPSVAGRINK